MSYDFGQLQKDDFFNLKIGDVIIRKTSWCYSQQIIESSSELLVLKNNKENQELTISDDRGFKKSIRYSNIKNGSKVRGSESFEGFYVDYFFKLENKDFKYSEKNKNLSDDPVVQDYLNDDFPSETTKEIVVFSCIVFVMLIVILSMC